MTEYFDMIHEGMPLKDIEIIDVHAHLGLNGSFHQPRSTADDMVWMMDRCGIDRTIISSTPALMADIVSGNTMMLEAVKTYRGRLYGACCVNGHYPELSIEELHRCFEMDKDVVAVKIHPNVTRCAMNDRRMKKIYEFASERTLFAVVHTWLDNDPHGNQDLFAATAKDYPRIHWLMGHSGGPFGAYHAVEIARELPNVYLDTVLSLCPARQIEFFVRELGAERLLFGTDNPFIDPRPQIGRVGLAEISHEDKVKVFGANARRIIRFTS